MNVLLIPNNPGGISKNPIARPRAMDVKIGYFNLSIIGRDIFIVNKLIKNHSPYSEIIIIGSVVGVFDSIVKHILMMMQKSM